MMRILTATRMRMRIWLTMSRLRWLKIDVALVGLAVGLFSALFDFGARLSFFAGSF